MNVCTSYESRNDTLGSFGKGCESEYSTSVSVYICYTSGYQVQRDSLKKTWEYLEVVRKGKRGPSRCIGEMVSFNTEMAPLSGKLIYLVDTTDP